MELQFQHFQRLPIFTFKFGWVQINVHSSKIVIGIANRLVPLWSKLASAIMEQLASAIMEQIDSSYDENVSIFSYRHSLAYLTFRN